MKKFKIDRKKIKFEYEFLDGTSVKFEYLEPTTEMIDKAVEIDTPSGRMEFSKESLYELLQSDVDGAVEKLIEEQMRNGNIYEFKAKLDEELGKLKKSV